MNIYKHKHEFENLSFDEKESHTNLLQQTLTTELQETVKYAFIKYRIVPMEYTLKLEMDQLKPSRFVFSCLTSQFLQQYLM